MSYKKTILFLGGSMQQVPAIKTATALGFRTVVIDYLDNNPGRLCADKWYCESTTDINAVLRIAKDENVSGILPYASDPAALPAAIVSEQLGLPTNSSRTVRILGIKNLFREFLKRHGFAHPASVAFAADDTIEKIKSSIECLSFPIMVKPTDSSGSKGVSMLESLDNIESAVSEAGKYSRNKILLAEEFIRRGYPNVIGGDVFVEDGAISLFGEMDCLRDNRGSNLIPIGKMNPSGLNSSQREIIRKEVQKLIESLGIKNGEFNIELLLDPDDKPYFLEFGPRAGGNMIPIQLSDAYEVDLLKANVLVAVGERPYLQPKATDVFLATHVIHSHKAGRLKEIIFNEAIAQHIYRKVLYKKPGDAIEQFDGAGKAIGIVFFRFKSYKEMKDYMNNIDSFINIALES